MDGLAPFLAFLARALHDLGMLLYAGPMVAFTVLILLSTRLPRLSPREIVRTYRAWGAGFGLAMGAWVLGLLSGHYLEQGAFRWGTTTTAEQLVLARHLVFLALWILNLRLEVWALEPLRKLDGEPGIAQDAAYLAGTRRLSRELVVQSLLLIAYVLLEG